jgi:hypothetical protein
MKHNYGSTFHIFEIGTNPPLGLMLFGLIGVA